MSRKDLEKWLHSLRPDLDPSLALAQFESTPAQPISVHPTSEPPNAKMSTAVIEDGGDEWFDVVGEIDPPIEDVGVERAYSGATEVLSEWDIGVMKEGPKKATEMEVGKPEQQSQPEEAEGWKELCNGRWSDACMNLAVEVGVNPTEGVEVFSAERVETNFAEARREEIVVVTDDEEVVEKETRRETIKQDTGGNDESTAMSVAEESRRKRRILMDEVTEEEEDDIIFQPIEETVESERRRERKRKGKEIIEPAMKKTKQPSVVVVIQERTSDKRRRDREVESEEEEALRWERRSKRKNNEI